MCTKRLAAFTLSLAVSAMVWIADEPSVWAQDIPDPLLRYIATMNSYRNATFSFEKYQDHPTNPSSGRIKVEYGTVEVDFQKNAYKEDRMGGDLKGFASHLIRSRVDGVTTRVSEDLNIPGSRYAVIGEKEPRFCPYNLLGLGFAISNNLGEHPDKILSLADYLIEGAHMGIREIDRNTFEIKHLGSTKRYTGEWRTDVIICLDPERRFLPKWIELRGRSFDNPAADGLIFRYEISSWTEINGVDFPTRIHDKESRSRLELVIQKESLKVNDPDFNVDYHLDLTGIRGHDDRTNTRFNVKELSPEEKEELRRMHQEADAAMLASRDAASNAQFNPPIWRNPRVYTVASGTLLIALGLAWYVAKYRRGLCILILVGSASIQSGCESNHHRADDEAQPKVVLERIDPTPVVIDYGKELMVNTRQSARISFKNISAQPVQWINVSTSCGCTSAKWSQDVVQPGETVTLEADVDPPKIGTPKLITVQTLYKCGNVEDELIVPITVKYDIDWAVEDFSIHVRGTVGEVGRGEFVVVVKPFADAPKLRLRDSGSIQLAGEPQRRKEDARRWIYTVTAPVEEIGVVSVGDITIVNDDSGFPGEYLKQVLTEGKSPGTWSKKVLVNPSESPVRATIACDAGWTVREFKSSDDRIEIQSTQGVDDATYELELRFREKIQGMFTVDANLEKEGRSVVSSLKIIFAGN